MRLKDMPVCAAAVLMPTLSSRAITNSAAYLEQVILPSYQAQSQQNMLISLIGVDGQILACSDLFAQALGYENYAALPEHNYRQLCLARIHQQALTISPELLESFNLVLLELDEIRQFAFQTKIIVNVLRSYPFEHQWGDGQFITTIMPLLSPDGEVVALEALTLPYGFCSWQELLLEPYLPLLNLKSTTAKLRVTSLAQLPLALTTRQHEIIFLLANGVSQRDISLALGISRGTIAKILTQSICPKFDIWGSSTVLLTRKAHQLGLHLMLPISLFRLSNTILDPSIAMQFADFQRTLKLTPPLMNATEKLTPLRSNVIEPATSAAISFDLPFLLHSLPAIFQLETEVVEQVLPKYLHLVDQAVNFSILDRQNRVIVCSNQLAKMWGCSSWLDLHGKSVIEYISESKQKSSCLVPACPENKLVMCELYHEFQQLTDFVFSSGRATCFARVTSFGSDSSNMIYISTISPIFNAKQQVVAVRINSCRSSLFGHLDYIKHLVKYEASQHDNGMVELKVTKLAQLPLKLSSRQHEILFLLANDMSQEEIAQGLGLSRGSIAKSISQTLSPKFGISGSNMRLLKDRLRELKIHEMIPFSLAQPKLRVLDAISAEMFARYKFNHAVLASAELLAAQIAVPLVVPLASVMRQ